MDGSVVNLKETDNGILAEVEGTERYDVFIELSNDTIRDMSCSCPYAESGKYCKHMAAVLFAVTGDEPDQKEWNDDYEDEYQHNKWYDEENEEDYEYYSRPRINTEELKSVIDLLPAEDAKYFLLEKASVDADLANEIFSHYRKFETRELIEGIFKKDASEWGKCLNAFLDNKVVELVSCGERNFAADVLKGILLRLDAFLTSFESLDVLSVSEKCFHTLVKLIGQIPFDYQKTDHITAVKSLVDGFRSKSLIECRKEFLNELKLIDPRYSKLTELDYVIRQCGNSNVCTSVYDENRKSVCAVTYRLELMRKLDFSEEEILNYRKTVRHFHVIRVMEIEEALKCSDAEKALRVIEESKRLDQDELMLRSLSDLAIQAYRMIGDTDSLKEEMKSLVLNIPQFGMEKILELKKVLTRNEWKEFVPELLKSQALARVRIDVMILEGMSDQVFKEIQHYHQFIKYEEKLKELDIYQAQNLLIRFLHQMAKYVNKRDEYHDLAQQLLKLVDYPGGYAEIQRIATEWKQLYNKRHAMMDELSFALRKWSFLR